MSELQPNYIDLPQRVPWSNSIDLPQHEFFVQQAATTSTRHPRMTLRSGKVVHRLNLPHSQWVSYCEVDMGRLIYEPDKISALAKLVKSTVEDPTNLQFGDGMPYSEGTLAYLFSQSSAMLQVAWEGTDKLLGYAYSAPYALGDITESIDSFPNDLHIVTQMSRKGVAVADIVTIADQTVRLTPQNTWVHDSFAAFKGIGAGTIFQNRMLERRLLMAQGIDKVVTFAVTGAYTESMLDRSPLLKAGRVLKCKVPYRDTTATLIINDLELKAVTRDDLISTRFK